MKRYIIMLKNGRHFQVEREKSPVGLWIWSLQQFEPKVLTFDGIAVLNTDISAIEECVECE